MRLCLIVIVLFFMPVVAAGQCPAQEAGWANIISISEARNLSVSQRLAKLLHCLKDVEVSACNGDSVHAMLLRLIGFAYSEQGHFTNAVQYFVRSIELINANKNKPSINVRELIGSYFWLSTFYDSLSNRREKKRAIDSCIAVSRRLGALTDISCIRSLAARAEYYFDVGDYYSCAIDADLCERLAWTFYATDKSYPEVGRYLALSSSGWRLEALVKLQKFGEAENYLLDKINGYKQKGRNDYLSFAYGQLAQLEVYKGACEKALILFDKALLIAKRGGYNFACKQMLNTIGHDIFFRKYKDAGRALQYYKQALRYVNHDKQEASADAIETVEILTRMGAARAQQGTFPAAFGCFQQAFDLLNLRLAEKDILRIPVEQLAEFKKAHILVELVIEKAASFLAKYKHDRNVSNVREAINIYRVADKLLVMLQANQSDLKSKLFWRSDSRRLYEEAIDACYLLGDGGEAFYFFEKSRAVLLNEQLAQQNLLQTHEISTQVQLRKKLLQAERQLDGVDANSPAYFALQKELFDGRQNMEALLQRIKAKNPLFYHSFVDTSATGLNDVRTALLQDHQALVEMFSGDSAAYVLLITKHKAFLNKINKAAFENLVSNYVRLVSNPFLLNRDFAFYEKVAHQLYSSLFQNLPIPDGRIIVSPDGPNFPFESLVVRTNASSPVYFLENHAVSYTYSARYLLKSFGSTATASPGNFFGIAPVRFGKQLSALPQSDKSLDRIAAYFSNATNLTGAEASKSNFVKQFGKYAIVQLYSHAAANSNAKEPLIYFADSPLRLSDLIPEEKPVTRLVVLSACETGNGQLYVGEGVFGFNRGFAACGVPSSITNLWSVDNESTYKLTELFYNFLHDGLPTDIALQRAKKELLRSSSRQEQLPYHWAAAVLIGRTEVFDCSQPFFPTLYYSLLALIFFSVAAAMGYKYFTVCVLPMQDGERTHKGSLRLKLRRMFSK